MFPPPPRLIEFNFVVELRTLHENHTWNTILENLSGELDASNKKWFERKLLFNNTSLFVLSNNTSLFGLLAS